MFFLKNSTEIQRITKTATVNLKIFIAGKVTGDFLSRPECEKATEIRKAITYGKLVEGIDVCKFGKQWVVSMAAMKREYGEPRI